jgi:hypothetical protein
VRGADVASDAADVFLGGSNIDARCGIRHHKIQNSVT